MAGYVYVHQSVKLRSTCYNYKGQTIRVEYVRNEKKMEVESRAVSLWFCDYRLHQRYEMFEEVECFANVFLEDEFSQPERDILFLSRIDDG